MTVSRLRMAYHVADDVTDVGRFYQQALGFRQRFQDADRWLEMQAGDSRFAVASPAEAPAGCSGPVLVFECDDLAAAADAIAAHGGAVLGQRDMGSHGRTLTARDPAGTVFQLYSR